MSAPPATCIHKVLSTTRTLYPYPSSVSYPRRLVAFPPAWVGRAPGALPRDCPGISGAEGGAQPAAPLTFQALELTIDILVIGVTLSNSGPSGLAAR
jgi:hypothetical protein